MTIILFSIALIVITYCLWTLANIGLILWEARQYCVNWGEAIPGGVPAYKNRYPGDCAIVTFAAIAQITYAEAAQILLDRGIYTIDPDNPTEGSASLLPFSDIINELCTLDSMLRPAKPSYTVRELLKVNKNEQYSALTVIDGHVMAIRNNRLVGFGNVKYLNDYVLAADSLKVTGDVRSLMTKA